MSKNSKQYRVSVRTINLRERRNPQVDDGWPDEDALLRDWYSERGDDPDTKEILWSAILLRYSAKERLVVKTIWNCWEFWMGVPQRALMVFDAIQAERWMLHGLPEQEMVRQAHESAKTIWETVVRYSDPRANCDLDLEDVLDQGECNNFCREDRDQCLEEIETMRHWYAHCLEHVRHERC